ncbi:MAG: four helix bundle protein [Pyrinomonadaceae bacterium]
MLKSYRDLLVWQKAMELTLEIYQFSSSFPRSEMYGLTSQLRRAGVSVPSNIAEGYGRGSRKEYVQFLCISQGSLKELETQVILAQRLSYGSTTAGDDLLTLSEEVGRMLGALIRSLRMKMA